MNATGHLGLSGSLKTRLIRTRPSRLSHFLSSCHRRLGRMQAAWGGGIVISSCLRARHYIALEDRWVDLGVLSRKFVTDAFVEFMVDNLKVETAAWGDFKYHDSGIGVGAENKNQTTLGTPCGDARDEGTQIEGAEVYIYKSVATHTYDEALAITEHGLFSAAAAGTMMDRSVFAAINVEDTDQIEFTYELTCTSGG